MQPFYLIYLPYSYCAVDTVLSFLPSVPSRMRCSLGSGIAFCCSRVCRFLPHTFPHPSFMTLTFFKSSVPISLLNRTFFRSCLMSPHVGLRGCSMGWNTPWRGCYVLLGGAHPEAYSAHLSLISDVRCKHLVTVLPNFSIASSLFFFNE